MDLAPHLLAAVDFRTLPEQFTNGLFLGSIYALIALGYTMVYGILKLINFAHGDVYMLGAYMAFFVSEWLGFGPGSNKQHSNLWNLALMLIASMVLCAVVGVIIERFAYRPLRSHPRIASLITAIGVSLFLEYGGALYLPNSPPPNINELVNPYRGSWDISIVGPGKKFVQAEKDTVAQLDQTKAAYDAYMNAHPDASEFDLPPDGNALRQAYLAARDKHSDAARAMSSSGVSIHLIFGDLIIFGTSVLLMGILTYLVMFTRAGRAMRAVSHDFDSAALMGVNVDQIVMFTFIIGSALAGAGAMMQATFKGTALTTFFGFVPGVKAFVAAVLGGIGNIPGAVLGGLLMGVSETTMYWLGYGRYADAIAFVILIVVLLFRPGGLLGSAKMEKV